MTARRRVIAVIGNGKATPEAERCAEELGRLIVEEGHRLVTGGLGGVMEAASRGAHRAGNYREGDVIGVLPSCAPPRPIRTSTSSCPPIWATREMCSS